MKKTCINAAPDPQCPIRNILSRISGKWTLLVLFFLAQQDKKMRFGELRRMIPDISQKMLTTTLRTLEEDGFVTREIYAEIPPRVEYGLTERAESLFPHLQSLIMWAQENMPAIMADRRQTQSAQMQPVAAL